MRVLELVGEVRARVLRIPAGAVATYGDIARALGVGPREVGRAMGLLDDGIPWHRVVHASGEPAYCHGGTALGLLRAEGTPLIGSRVDLRAARWDPDSESGRGAASG